MSPSTERVTQLSMIAKEIAELYSPQRVLDADFFEANRYDVTDAEMPIVLQLVRDEHGIESEDEVADLPDLEPLQIQTSPNIGLTPSKRKRTVHTTPLSSPIIRTKNTARAENEPVRKKSLVEKGKKVSF